MGPLEGRTSRYIFSPEEIADITQRYPKLQLTTTSTWEGTLDVYASFNEVVIQDSFQIKIGIPFGYPDVLPFMFETGGRTQAIIQKYQMNDPRDLHVNTNNQWAACLCVKQEEKKKFPPGSTIPIFIENLVVPYLYGLGYYDQYKKWPWGERAHGALGVLEFYAEEQGDHTEETMLEAVKSIRGEKNWVEYDKQLKRPSAKKSCLCGSNEPFKKCHPGTFKGVVRFNNDLKRLSLITAKLFGKVST